MVMILSCIKKGSLVVLIFIQLLLALLFVCSLVSPYYSPAANPFIARCGLFFQLIYLLNIVTMFFLLCLKSRALFLSLVVFVIGLPGIKQYYNYNFFNEFNKEDNEINLASFNMQFSKSIALAEQGGNKEVAKQFDYFLHSNKEIDIFCVQEFGWRTAAHVEGNMDFPYVHKVENMTVGILSKFPLIDKGVVDFKSNIANTCIWADIKLPSDTIRVYSFHLESNRHDGEVPQVIEQESPEDKRTSAMLGIIKYYPPFSEKRLVQVQLIKAHAALSPYPVILAGDLNDTPHSKVYKEIAEGYKDGFASSFGSGKTIESRIPLLRIDYILSSGCRISDLHTIPNAFSDHYLLSGNLDL